MPMSSPTSSSSPYSLRSIHSHSGSDSSVVFSLLARVKNEFDKTSINSGSPASNFDVSSLIGRDSRLPTFLSIDLPFSFSSLLSNELASSHCSFTNCRSLSLFSGIQSDYDQSSSSSALNAECLHSHDDIDERSQSSGDETMAGGGQQPLQRNPFIKILDALFAGVPWVYQKRKRNKLKEKFLRHNGGSILRQQLSVNAAFQTPKLFTAEELETATNNYHDNLIIGRGGFGIVYKGFLADNTVVAIKKSKLVNHSQIQQFIDNVVLLSQINHRNAVKVLGCCLETQVPLLVYEFVNNGTLFDYINSKSKTSNDVSLETRLKIAAEAAAALSYLHSAASIPMIHGDVKTLNILLDESYTAKVTDFAVYGLVPFPLDEYLELDTTMVQGTFAYLDPEYLYTNQLTEKSDVYSFGVVLVELLTGKKPLSFDRSKEERTLALHFLSSLKKGELLKVVEVGIVNNKNMEMVQEVANLAARCLRVRGKERPNMEEVAMEIEGIRMIGKHLMVDKDVINLEETQSLIMETSDLSECGESINLEETQSLIMETSDLSECGESINLEETQSLIVETSDLSGSWGSINLDETQSLTVETSDFSEWGESISSQNSGWDNSIRDHGEEVASWTIQHLFPVFLSRINTRKSFFESRTNSESNDFSKYKHDQKPPYHEQLLHIFYRRGRGKCMVVLVNISVGRNLAFAHIDLDVKAELENIIVMSLNVAMKLKLALLACAVTAAAGEFELSKAGCESSCGNVSIPYPFGTREGCFRDDNFLISCNSSSGKPMANYSDSNIQVLHISLNGEMRISTWVSYLCNEDDDSTTYFSINPMLTISNVKNKFTVIGCNTIGSITDIEENRFQTGCLSICKNMAYVTNGSCSGIGCCHTTFPTAIGDYSISIKYYNKTLVHNSTPCSYAFVVEHDHYSFSSLDLHNHQHKTDSPVLLNWVVDSKTCAEAKTNKTTYACKDNTICEDSLQVSDRIGYLCKCKPGFQGNPYLSHPLGCKDIDECSIKNNCSKTCQNIYGNYTCSCPWGYRGDGYIHGSGCSLPIIEISLGISVALLFVITLVFLLCWVHKRRTLKQLRRRNFEQNGGTMLQGYGDRTKIFTEVELKTATDNFDENKILGRGGQGTVYKGILPDNTPVAIKKSIVGGDPRQIKDFINELAVLSQINHRNVVKLLGCCLETQAPLLVYEFVDNGTLLDHIDPLKSKCPISWETRLRIAAETSEAISYLHSAASIPIIHRDIKSTNILLDHNHRAKVSDFGASKLVPLDETQITTVVQGTLGYLDPEYLQTGQLNEKSDVYSFGVVLVELLTGNKAVEFNRPEQKNLAMYFVSSMKEDNLWEILDRQMLEQKKNAEQVKKVALLARKCLRVVGEERPTMKEVAMELDGLIAMENHPSVKGEDPKSEENENTLDHVDVVDEYRNASASNSAAYDSIQKQISFEDVDGR
ncbi:putative wall-associated receptor kinase-like 16 [Senna tora]|uniref:Putative wall-associated receptor kinase-like 16 n=1 Tax=Senna tora TaxID=362788 RepID=A0A834T9L2_9FABA|nr:putative wall-associated receptor kinase-like 16 [Senna tora]